MRVSSFVLVVFYLSFAVVVVVVSVFESHSRARTIRLRENWYIYTNQLHSNVTSAFETLSNGKIILMLKNDSPFHENAAFANNFSLANPFGWFICSVGLLLSSDFVIVARLIKKKKKDATIENYWKNYFPYSYGIPMLILKFNCASLTFRKKKKIKSIFHSTHIINRFTRFEHNTIALFATVNCVHRCSIIESILLWSIFIFFLNCYATQMNSFFVSVVFAYYLNKNETKWKKNAKCYLQWENNVMTAQ